MTGQLRDLWFRPNTFNDANQQVVAFGLSCLIAFGANYHCAAAQAKLGISKLGGEGPNTPISNRPTPTIGHERSLPFHRVVSRDW